MDDFKNPVPNEVSPSPTRQTPGEIRADYDAIDPVSGVKRGLKTRHLSMMALAGIVRTQFFPNPIPALSLFIHCLSCQPFQALPLTISRSDPAF